MGRPTLLEHEPWSWRPEEASMAGPVERRQQDRRSGEERRASFRIDPFPRRTKLRRQADLLAYLLSAVEKEQPLASKTLGLDETALRF